MTMVARLGLSHHGPWGTEVSILAHPGLFPPLRGTEVPGRGSGKVRRHFPLGTGIAVPVPLFMNVNPFQR